MRVDTQSTADKSGKSGKSSKSSNMRVNSGKSDKSGKGKGKNGANSFGTPAMRVGTSCKDDPTGDVAKSGFTCSILSTMGCNLDLSTLQPDAPKGSFVKLACPSTCNACPEVEASNGVVNIALPTAVKAAPGAAVKPANKIPAGYPAAGTPLVGQWASFAQGAAAFPNNGAQRFASSPIATVAQTVVQQGVQQLQTVVQQGVQQLPAGQQYNSFGYNSAFQQARPAFQNFGAVRPNVLG